MRIARLRAAWRLRCDVSTRTRFRAMEKESMKTIGTKTLAVTALVAATLVSAAPAAADYDSCKADASSALDECYLDAYGYYRQCLGPNSGRERDPVCVALWRALQDQCFAVYQEAELACQQENVESCADYCYDYGQANGESWSWEDCYGWCAT